MANDTTSYSIHLSTKVIDPLKRTARYVAFERDDDVTVADLIKEAIVRTYPMPETDESEKDEASRLQP